MDSKDKPQTPTDNSSEMAQAAPPSYIPSARKMGEGQTAPDPGILDIPLYDNRNSMRPTIDYAPRTTPQPQQQIASHVSFRGNPCPDPMSRVPAANVEQD
ncbi:MAG: hypothetical protein Q9161_009145 [Pseudevernia consocians]